MAKLALLGGEKTVSEDSGKVATVPLVPEKAYAKIEALCRAGEISFSSSVGEFERRYADYIGCKYGICVTNGTTSIFSGLFGVGVRPGDEVIVPSFTFWASVGPVAALGAVPVFADIDPDTHLLTAETIEKKITPKTKAVLVVHTWGNPVDMPSVMALAKKHNLKVVEDCSHAHGSTVNGVKVGCFGDVGCFSMQGSKTLPAGEGGILVTSDRDVYERALALGHYDRLGGTQFENYSLTGFGFKFRAHPLAIAIADASLDTLDELNALRSKNAAYLEKLVSDLPYITTQKVLDGCKRIYSYHYVRYNPEYLENLNLNTLLMALSAEGVSCGSCGYGFLHKSALYTGDNMITGKPFAEGYKPSDDLPNTDYLAARAFMMAPRFETECTAHVEQYAAAYHKIAENIDELIKYEIDNNLRDAKIKNSGRSINLYKKA